MMMTGWGEEEEFKSTPHFQYYLHLLSYIHGCILLSLKMRQFWVWEKQLSAINKVRQGEVTFNNTMNSVLFMINFISKNGFHWWINLNQQRKWKAVFTGIVKYYSHSKHKWLSFYVRNIIFSMKMVKWNLGEDKYLAMNRKLYWNICPVSGQPEQNRALSRIFGSKR